MTVIELPDNQAAAQGLTLKAWLGKRADTGAKPKPKKSAYGLLASVYDDLKAAPADSDCPDPPVSGE